MRDFSDAQGQLRRWGSDGPVQQQDLDSANSLVESYLHDRDELLKKMLELMTAADAAGIDDAWKDQCSRGKELLSTLNDRVPPRDGEGLAGILLDGFYRGELRIWDAAAQLAIPLAAVRIDLLKKVDLQYIADAEIRLGEIKDQDPSIQEAVRGIFPSFVSSLTDTVVNLGKLAWTARGSGMMLWAKDYSDSAAALAMSRFKDILDLARRRAALRKGLIKHLETVANVHDQIDTRSIQEACAAGIEATNALTDGAGSNGYNALDWQDFAHSCRERLAERRDVALEVARHLLDELGPQLRERVAVDFRTLFANPDDLARWNDQVTNYFSQIRTGIDTQRQYINSLSTGAYRDAASQLIDQVRTAFDNIVQYYSTNQKEVDEKMRES